MTRLYRVSQTRVALVRAVDPEEAIQLARELGTIEVVEVTGEDLARHERERAPRSPSTFELQAAAVKRASGTMQAVRIPDTDPAPGPIPREEPEG